MKERTIGDRRAGEIGLGGMPMSIEGRPDEARSIATVHAALHPRLRRRLEPRPRPTPDGAALRMTTSHSARRPYRTLGQSGAVELELTTGEVEMLTAVSVPASDDYPYGEPDRAQHHRELSR